MCDLPAPILAVLDPFALAFSPRVWNWAVVLLVGAILAPGQPTLAHWVADPATVWHGLRVRWYGGEQRAIELATGTAVWYHSGLPPVALRWVHIRAPLGKCTPQALRCTDLEAAAQQIVEWFVLRGNRK